MLTKNEISALTLSPTKKDFVQIWNELLEVAGKLSERWDPTSTNESDPGIVILKALAGIADRLNYNIDKNTLEAFMPTAAQEDSMRKLCDMLGYNVKYYRSAETQVTIKYYNPNPTEEEETALSGYLWIPKFTVVTNSDQDISYFTTNQVPYSITSTTPSVTLDCMEGQIVKCESFTDNNVITSSQISDNNRFYLPESQIAENGIFIYNVLSLDGVSLEDGIPWEKVDNLNIQVRGSRVFKFGYDSYESRPYVEFPDDYSELINDGLFIYYARTNGANGNISARTLTKIELPSGDYWNSVSAENFTVENVFAATTGSNVETIRQAYNNFKKTVGTFETLVTCRDYMNKIYTMTESGKPLVSNILVTDIRNDLNRAVTICSCDDAGIFYKEMPLIKENLVETELEEILPVDSTETEVSETRVASTANKPIYSNTPSHHQYGATFGSSGFIVRGAYWHLGAESGLPIFNDKYSKDFVEDASFIDKNGGDVSEYKADGSESDYWLIKQGGKIFTTKLPINWITSKETTQTKTVNIKTITKQITKVSEPEIDHFDLVLYPFKSYNQIRNNVKDIQEVYDSSFKYSPTGFNKIKTRLEEDKIKTIAHSINSPRENDIISINNYLRLSAVIGTNTKVTAEECTLLIENIKIALANAFNMRELDFGEEIPFDSIVEVIEKADSKIKVVSLNEPALYTTYSVYEGLDKFGNPKLNEYAVASNWLSETAAVATGRFEDKNNNSYTFDTTEAKKIYNKLAVRNVLAGRVPLFKYNNTFKTSFSEGEYQKTENISAEDFKAKAASAGLSLGNLSEDNPFITFTADGKIYTAQRITLSEKPDGMAEPTEGQNDEELIDSEQNVVYVGKWDSDKQAPSYAKIVYAETSTPDVYTDTIKNDKDKSLTSITTSCKIKANDNTQNITNATLAKGEFIKFRAPNFTTIKTYPAYVNYHLKLNDRIKLSAKSAEADTLFNLLNENYADSLSRDEKWESVINYFSKLGRKKTFKFTQRISKVSTGTTAEPTEPTFNITEFANDILDETPSSILKKSGCVKLVKKEPTFEWVGSTSTSKKENFPAVDVFGNLETYYVNNANFFDQDPEVVGSLPNLVRARLLELLKQNKLPKSRDWTISYEFEYVPFDGNNFAEWENFVISEGKKLFGFKPEVDGETVLWRSYGTGYSIGRYITSDSAKLMPLTSSFLSAIDTPTLLMGVYVAKDLGRDAEVNSISNNEEYMLREGEYLYIEYTPSSTTEDGTSQDLEPIKEVHGPGTIIRPSGFETALSDSTAYHAAGNQPHKTVNFNTSSSISTPVDMYSFGANEQVEIRDFSQVVINRNTFTSAAAISLYKNFNDCPELETAIYEKGKRKNNSYTLKDGEYIFYTDVNKAELGYFTTGTEVILEGRLTIPKFDAVDFASIFDSGLQEIPWVTKSLSADDSITFKEFQYITLGQEDTIKKLTLVSDGVSCLTDDWQKCDNVEYLVAGSDTESKLPKINIYDSSSQGNGWEVSSILELNVSPNSSQTLRTTDKIETSVTLEFSSPTGSEEIVLKAENESQPLSFKTNIPCQSSASKIDIADIYATPEELENFEVKIFAEEAPALLQTQEDSLLPYYNNSSAAGTEWTTTTISLKNYGELWNQVSLSKFTPEDSTGYSNTLKLSTNILPHTYGIFSIYLDYGNIDVEDDEETWIELLPGTPSNTITMFNADNEWLDDNKTKLRLNPGINCIRVNRTSNLYIKTTRQYGALYFDDLRLVDSTPIEYVENGQTKLQNTLGLNLDQIGYLDVSDKNENTDTFNAFDMRIRRKLRTEYYNNTISELDNRAQLENKNTVSLKQELIKSKSKLQALVDFLETSKKELEFLTVDQPDNLSSLFQNYVDIYNNLAQELGLRDALENNKNIDSVEQQLIEILGNFSDSESLRQELLTQLEQLKSAAEANANEFSEDTLSRGDILDDFEAIADTSIYPYLVDDIKFASIRKINTRYGEQLDKLANEIENVITSEEALKAALNSLYATKHNALLSQINELINAYSSSLSTYLSAASDLIKGDLSENDGYNKLISTLSILREYVSESSISLLIAKIKDTADNSLYTELAEAIDALQLLLETQGTNSTIISGINALIEEVESRTISADFKTKLEAVSTSINTYYISKLSTILTNIETILTTLNDTYSDSVAVLQAQEDNQANIILSRLTAISNTTAACLTLVKDFGVASDFDIKTDYIALPFGEQAVLSAWPIYMQQALILSINELYKDIRTVIKGDIDLELEFNDRLYVDKSNEIIRPVLAKAANIVAFKDLFNSAKALVKQINQTNGRKELLEQLSASIVLPSSVSEAMDNISIEDRNAVICEIISQLTQPSTTLSLVEKQQLIKQLKEELDKAIYLDSQLEEISAKLLCPSILVFDKVFSGDISDSFYSALKDFIEAEKLKLLANELSNSSLETLLSDIEEIYAINYSLLSAFNVNDITSFTEWSNLSSEKTKLTTDFVNKLASIHNSNMIQEQIQRIKNCELFKFLSRDFVIAWENQSGEWLDSQGNSLEGITAVIELKHYNDGSWKDIRSGAETEIEVRKDDNIWLIGADEETVDDSALNSLLTTLYEDTEKLGENRISTEARGAVKIAALEEDLLADIASIDRNRDFYYNVPVEVNVAIDFNEGDSSLNTLMNPATNYDINNVNNAFVISKLDINYLTDGLQIARSSKLN